MPETRTFTRFFIGTRELKTVDILMPYLPSNSTICVGNTMYRVVSCTPIVRDDVVVMEVYLRG